jgi:hypothetical protein
METPYWRAARTAEQHTVWGTLLPISPTASRSRIAWCGVPRLVNHRPAQGALDVRAVAWPLRPATPAIQTDGNRRLHRRGASVVAKCRLPDRGPESSCNPVG